MEPPDYDHLFSDVRARLSGSPRAPSSALGRFNVSRLTRHNDIYRAWESRAANRLRRAQGPLRASPPSAEEHASKRRRTERSGQVEMEQLSMELRYCDGGRYDSSPAYTRDYSPECALRDDSTGACE